MLKGTTGRTAIYYIRYFIKDTGLVYSKYRTELGAANIIESLYELTEYDDKNIDADYYKQAQCHPMMSMYIQQFA
jgi:hypothetical protein